MTEDDKKLPPPVAQAPSEPGRIDIVEPVHVDPVFVDWIVNGGESGGVLHVAFGTTDNAYPGREDGTYRVLISSRLRMPLATAERVYHLLGQLLGHDPDSGPQPPPEGPKGKTLN